jgi:hypothetical protein
MMIYDGGIPYRVSVIDGFLYVNSSPVEQYPLRIQMLAYEAAKKAGILE